jgi:hypothetical protein
MDSDQVGKRSQLRHYPYWYEGTLSTWPNDQVPPHNDCEYRTSLRIWHVDPLTNEEICLLSGRQP